MTELKKTIVNAIQSGLRPQGFEKDGSVWFRQRDGIVSMLGLEQSPHGFQNFWLEIGLYVRALAEQYDSLSKKGVPRPSIGGWHLIGQLDQYNAELKTALTGDAAVSDEFRRSAIQSALQNRALPLFASFETRDGIRKHFPQGGGFTSTARLRKFIESSDVT